MILALLVGCLSAEQRFADEVAPILAARCGGTACHGVGPGQEWGALPADGWFFAVSAAGDLHDLDAARTATQRFIDPTEDPLASPLLRKALPRAYGGVPHAGGALFPSPDDPALAAIADWIRAEPEGGATPPPLSPLEVRFRDEVLPSLDALGCGNGACHGPTAAIPFRLDPGVPSGRTVTAVRASYLASREMLAVEGDPLGSRLLRKGLPLTDGGILHKGGNERFFGGRDDARVTAITAWACAERAAGLGLPCGQADAGLLVVRAPARPPEDPFATAGFVPGASVWRREPDGSWVDLVGDLHGGAGDARDPALHPDGRRLVFALRQPGDAGHTLWERDLLTGETRALTAGDAEDREPAWGPEDTLWFVSTGAGLLRDDGRAPDTELYTLDADGARARRSFTPAPERRPTWLHVGHEAGAELAFTALRAAEPGAARAHPFRFPPGLETEYHQHFGASLPETWVDDLAETPDGRYLAVAGALGDVTGRLVLIDRNFGPRLAEGAATSLAGYRDPVVVLDASPVWRRPTIAPGGGFVASRLTESGFELVSFRVEDDARGTRLADARVLAAEPGFDLFSGGPAGPRPAPALRGDWAWSEGASDGVIRHGGLPMIDAILRELSPSGARVPDAEIAAVRVILGERSPIGAREPLPEGAFGAWPDATTTGMSAYAPASVLAELTLPTDGSFHLQIPAGSAVRLQALDAAGLARGAAHNRWFDVHPGQVVPQGVGAARYREACADCHGQADGEAVAAHQPVDAITGASVTLARYEAGDRRRPLPPTAPAPIPSGWGEVRGALTRCLPCHEVASPRLVSTSTTWFDAAYEALHDGWVRPGRARESALVEVLRGEELDASRPLPPGAVPHGGLSEAELRLVQRWIDVGAPFSGGAP